MDILKVLFGLITDIVLLFFLFCCRVCNSNGDISCTFLVLVMSFLKVRFQNGTFLVLIRPSGMQKTM